MFVKLAALLFSIVAYCDSVKLISTYSVNPTYYTDILRKQGLDILVTTSDFGEYKKLLKKDEEKFFRWFRDPISIDSILVFYNLSDGVFQDYDLWRLPKEKMILFHWEPPHVLGGMYKSKVTDYFSRVYTWDDDLVDGKKFFKLFYPDMNPMIEGIIPFEEKKLCTFVGTNIHCKGTLYAEREKAISFFESVGEAGFEFYGRRWDEKTHPSYRGPIEDKIGTIKNYRFSIAYENSEHNGYITEKIFQCFTAGNVPIYLGAPNITSYIPKDCFIDRRDFRTFEDLYFYIKTMSKEEYEGYIERIRAFLKSKKARKFSKEYFEKLFADAIRSAL